MIAALPFQFAVALFHVRTAIRFPALPLHGLAALVVDPALLLVARDPVVAVVAAIVTPVASIIAALVARIMAVVTSIIAPVITLMLVCDPAILFCPVACHALGAVAALLVDTAVGLLLALALLLGQAAFARFTLARLFATLLGDASLHVFALFGLAPHALVALACLHVEVLAALLFAFAAALVPVLAAFRLPAAIALLQRRARLLGLAFLHLRLPLRLLALRLLALRLFATGLAAIRLLPALLAVVAILVLVLLKGERGGSGADGEQGAHQRNGEPASGEMAGHDLLHLVRLHRPRTIRAVGAVSGVKDESILRFSVFAAGTTEPPSSYSDSPIAMPDVSVYGFAGFSRRAQTLLAIFHSPSTLSSTK